MGRPRTGTSLLDIKHAVRERDGFRCTGCGLSNEDNIARTGRQLQVHRLTPGSLYSVEPGVCVTLCTKCHGPQSRRKRGQPDLARANHTKQKGVWVYLPPALFAAFLAYVESVSPRTSKTAVIEYILERLLTEKGFYPPRKGGA